MASATRSPPQPVDHVDRPRWPTQIERGGHDLGDLVGELPVVTRGRQVVLHDVVVDVELRVVDPVRQVEVERDLDHPLAERRHELDPVRDHGADLLGRQRPLVDRESRDVAVDPAVLGGDELRVD